MRCPNKLLRSFLLPMKDYYILRVYSIRCLEYWIVFERVYELFYALKLIFIGVSNSFRSIHFISISVKVGLSLSKIKFFICFNDSPSKTMKNAFYFILKVIFILKIFKFLSWHYWACRKNGLMRKKSLISKFIASQPG